MPTYYFKNYETGDEFEVDLRISDLDKFKEDNPQWTQQIKRAPNLNAEVGGSLKKAGGGWKDVLGKVKDTYKINNIRD